jgi:hypothetical protein
MAGMDRVAAGSLGMVGGLFVVSGVMMLCRFSVVASGMGVVFGCLFVVLGCFLGHLICSLGSDLETAAAINDPERQLLLINEIIAKEGLRRYFGMTANAVSSADCD